MDLLLSFLHGSIFLPSPPNIPKYSLFSFLKNECYRSTLTDELNKVNIVSIKWE